VTIIGSLTEGSSIRSIARARPAYIATRSCALA
jgi:hypothetical protein